MVIDYTCYLLSVVELVLTEGMACSCLCQNIWRVSCIGGLFPLPICMTNGAFSYQSELLLALVAAY